MQEMSKTPVIVEQFISYNISNLYNVLSWPSIFKLDVGLSCLGHADFSTVQ